MLREFLLTKLINAEISCYKAQRFSKLEVEKQCSSHSSVVNFQACCLITLCLVCSCWKLRTRSSLLESLHTELSTRSHCMMGDSSLPVLPSSEGVRGVSEGSGGFIENFKVNIVFFWSLILSFFELTFFFFYIFIFRGP